MSGITPEVLMEMFDGNNENEIVVNNRWLNEITADCLQALSRAHDLYRRGNRLVRVERHDDRHVAIEVGRAQLAGILDRLATFVRITKEGKHPAWPPDDVLDDVLARPPEEWPVPPLRGIRRLPAYARDPDGHIRLINTPGYDPISGIYLSTKDVYEANMSVREAIDTIQDVIGDFPFVADWSLANAYAMMILPYVRPLIDGPTPLHLIEAPTRGTGKGLLAEVITMIATGNSAAIMALPANDEETEKRITAGLMSASDMVLLDNVKEIKHPSLAAVLTSTWWEGRRLGKSELIRVPNTVTWAATGNNVWLSDEIARRTIKIKLDSGTERPEERRGFRHDPLIPYVRDRHHQIVSAVLSLIHAWVREGAPHWHDGRLGSYESWSSIIGGILSVAGISGFLSRESREAVYGESDRETAEWQLLVQIWWDTYGPAQVTAGDLLSIAVTHGLLSDVWSGRSKGGAAKRMGHALADHRDRVYAGYRIMSTIDYHRKSNAYRLVPAGGTAQATAQAMPQTPPAPPDPPAPVPPPPQEEDWRAVVGWDEWVEGDQLTGEDRF